MKRKRLVLALVALFLTTLTVGILVACNEAPTNVPVRTFERAQKMDVVCLQLFDNVTGLAIVPRPLPQEQCAPVAAGVNGGGLDNQLFGLVTQSTRGELAVVNLSAGFIQDLSRATPGINFLPVGALPTDVATTPDGEMAFVSSAEPNKAAIYGITTRRILGDLEGFPADPDGPVGLTSWPVCALPQNPGALVVVPRRPVPGAEGGVDPFPYELVAILSGDRRSSAKIVTIDPRPFLRAVENPRPATSAASRFGDGPILAPGSLAPCPITAAIELSGAPAVPAAFHPGPRWQDGVPYLDGGVDLSCDQPTGTGSCGPATCGCDTTVPTDGGAEAGTGACTPPGEKDAGDLALDLGPLEDPRLVAATLDDQTLYVADANLPLIHTIDLSTPGAPAELPPFVATSVAAPSRIVSVSAVAVSPPTRDFRRFLYAVDRDDGSIMAYEITDPHTTVRTPMRRPHPELNPFQVEDRISFGAPAVAVSFARHDFPLARINNVAVPNARSGLLCNPNGNLNTDAGVGDPNAAIVNDQFGYFYRNDSNDPAVALGPRRLRGIFAFATLANGSIVAIDVDDWDAPCRRPQFLSADPSPSRPIFGDAGTEPLNPLGSLAARQPGSATDFDPYHSPFTVPGSTSEEITFPISVPHRIRSDSFFSANSQFGNRVPRLDGLAKIQSSGVPLAFNGSGAEKTPLVLPANASKPTLANITNAIGVQFADEVPDVHTNQDWSLTYEGLLPGFDGISATLSTPDAYASLVLTQPNGRFCAKGIEDFDRGRERAKQIVADLVRGGGTPPGPPALQDPNLPDSPTQLPLDRQIVDYIQLTEDLLPPDDGYWGLSEDPNDPNKCWDPALSTAQTRYDACWKAFGSAADPNVERDFPILEAYGDRLVVGTFAPQSDATRDVVYKDATYNAPRLKRATCCFHRQIRFHVRTGGVWALLGFLPGGSGLGVGFLSHVKPDAGGRCVTSCEPRDALLNSRAPAVPSSISSLLDGRNSALAVRNPMMSFWVVDGTENAKPPPRDAVYTFQSRGSFSSLTINLAAATVAVSPQSMRFIETLGQIAVVDAASQGLVLIDLAGVTIAHAPYF